MQDEQDTSGALPDARGTPGIAERRAQPRQRSTSIAYIELGDSNGGIVLNVSEGGLALTAVGVLTVGSVPRIRIQLPRSRDWTEISGQVAWISESKREAGLRFENLTEEVRDRIRKWISSEVAATVARRDIGAISKKTALPENPKQQIRASSMRVPATPDAAAAPGLISTASAKHSRDAKGLRSQAFSQPVEETSQQAASTENSIQTAERRLHARRRVKSLSYIELGDRNGGIVIDMSEDGLQVQAAVTLTGQQVPLIHFQSPQTGNHVEASGKVVWTSESKKEAGIQFIDLPEDERAKLREWVASEPPSTEVRTVEQIAHDKVALPLEAAKPPASRRPLSEAGTFDRPVRSQPAVAAASRLANSPLSMRSVEKEVPQPTSALQILKSAGILQAEPPQKLVIGRMNQGRHRRTWQVIAAVVAIVAAISFSVGWLTTRRTVRDLVAAIRGTNEVAATQPAETGRPGPANEIAGTRNNEDKKSPATDPEVAPASATNKSRGSGLAAEPVRPESDTAARSSENAIPTVLGGSADKAKSAAGAIPPPVAGAAANVSRPPAKTAAVPKRESAVTQPAQTSPARPSPAPDPTPMSPRPSPATSSTPNPTPVSPRPDPATSSSPNPKLESPRASSATSPASNPTQMSPRPNPAPSPTASPTPNRPEITPPVAASHNETVAPAPKQPEIPVAPRGTVSVSYPAFPSIRVSPLEKSQSSKVATSLQIGQLISQVTPAYPEELLRQRIEGSVKLHVMIGTDGAIHSVTPVSGSTILATPAINAIEKWRFKPTILGGQAVEAEEDITIDFRLQN